MGRLIDKDKLIYEIYKNPKTQHNERCAQLLEAIANAPTVDAVEVVRCEKCKNAIKRQEDDFDGLPPYYCPFVSDYVRDNDFCCNGERRSDEQI